MSGSDETRKDTGVSDAHLTVFRFWVNEIVGNNKQNMGESQSILTERFCCEAPREAWICSHPHNTPSNVVQLIEGVTGGPRYAREPWDEGPKTSTGI